MKTSRLKSAWLLLSVVSCLLITGCGIHYNVKGRVVDATTGEPIEGASVAIHWIGTKIISACLAPYASGDYTIEKAKDVSDKDGYFSIPKYFFKSVYMGVYKKGYVCWNNTFIFLQEPIKIKDQYGVKIEHTKERTDFNVIGKGIRDGMVIELEPFTATDMEIRTHHAFFVDSVSGSAGGLSGIGEELDLVMEDIRKKKEVLNKKEKQEKTGAPR